MRAIAALSCAAALWPGCRCDSPDAAPPSGAVELLEVSADGRGVEPVIQRELERARADGRRLVVYVGASWCEPCTRFHDAVASGALDERFPRLRLLEFDHDRDEAALEAAGCGSQLLPLFALPTAEGRCSADQRIMGSVKGPGAVDNIAPRLTALLESS